VLGLLVISLVCLPALGFAKARAGMQIVNTSYVKYSTTQGPQTVSSNTVYTEIMPVYGLEILPNGTVEAPGQTRFGTPGIETYFSYILYNTGNITDTYDLRCFNVEGFNGFPYYEPDQIRIYHDLNGDGLPSPREPQITQAEDIEPDGFINLAVAILLDLSIPEGAQGYFNIEGRSIHSTAADIDNVARVDVSNRANLVVNKSVDRQEAAEGDTLEYIIEFRNLGNNAARDVIIQDIFRYQDDDSLYITYVPRSFHVFPEGQTEYLVFDSGIQDTVWVDQEPDAGEGTDVLGIRHRILSLGSQETGRFRFKVRVNDNVPGNLRLENYGTYSYSTLEGEPQETNEVITLIPPVAEVWIGPLDRPRFPNDADEYYPERDRYDTPDISSVRQIARLDQQGRPAVFFNTILNSGNTTDDINVFFDRENSTLPPNSVVFFYSLNQTDRLDDASGDGIPDVRLRPGERQTIVATVGVTDTTAIGDNNSMHWDLVVRVESTVDPDARPNYTIDRIERIQAFFAPLKIEVEPEEFVKAGEWLKYTITFENLSIFDITNAILTDEIDFRLTDVTNWTDGRLMMYQDTVSVIRRNINNQNKAEFHQTATDSLEVLVSARYDEPTRSLIWTFPTLPRQSWGQVTFNARVIDNAVDLDSIPNMATLESIETEVAFSEIVVVTVLNPMVRIDKRVLRKTVERGGLVEYEIDFENVSPTAYVSNGRLYDFMPNSFRYVKGSSKVDGIPFSDPIQNGSQAVWVIPDSLAPKEKRTLRYLSVAGVNTQVGEHINVARMTGNPVVPPQQIISPERVKIIEEVTLVSNDDQAVVRVIEGVFRPEGRLLGRVFVDENNNRIFDEGDVPLHKVRLYMEDGRYIITDANGLYSVDGIDPGVHVIKLDMVTVPPDLIPLPVDNHFVGSATTQFVDLMESGLVKANFRLVRPLLATIDVQKAYLSQEVRLLPGQQQEAVQVLEIPESHFDTGKAELLRIPDEFHQLIAFLETHPDWQILIEGHTDIRPIHTPEFPSNQELSEARAEAVAAALDSLGANRANMVIKGYGPSIPKVPNTSLKNMALNRRVEITLLPPGAEKPALNRVQYIFRIDRSFEAMTDVRLVSEDLNGTYLPESVRWNDAPYDSVPQQVDGQFIWNLGDFPDGMKGIFTYAVEVDTENMPEVLGRLAYIEWTDARGNPRRSKEFTLNLQPEFVADENELTFTLGDFLFDTGKADLRPGSYHYLDRIVEILQEIYPTATGRVEGHTDIRPINTPEFPSNWELSEARARVVYQYLVDHGVDPDRMTWAGFAATRPVAPNTTLENMQKNRRTEVIIELPERLSTMESRRQSTRMELKLEADGMFDSLTVKDQLPPQLAYVPGSAEMDGRPLPDPVVLEGGKLEWHLKNVPAGVSFIQYEVKPLGEAVELDSLPKPDVNGKPSSGRKLIRKSKTPTSSVPSSSAETLADVDSSWVSEGVDGEQTPAMPRKEVSEMTREELLALKRNQKAFVLSPQDGEVYTTRSKISVSIQVPLAANYELRVNGKVVPNDQVGEKRLNAAVSLAQYDYFSVPIQLGKNELVAVAIMPGRKEIVSDPVYVYYADRPAQIKFKTEPKYPTSDGVTEPTLIMEILDKNGIHVADNIFVTVAIDHGDFVTPDAHPGMPGHQVRTKDGFAKVQLSPSYEPEVRFFTATISTSFQVSKRIEFLPELRDFTFVALGEGTIGYQTFSGDRSKMPPDVVDDYEEEVWTDAGLQLFLRGRILGKYLLTAQYDSRKVPNKDKLFEQIDPDSYYPIYGDASKTGYDSESQSPLYVRIERNKSYTMYGDYRAGLTQTELTRYDRAYQGVKTHLENDYLNATGFVTYSNQAFQREEIPSEGISGYYFLSHVPLVENSEKVTVEVRDRFHSENILSRKDLVRHTDYQIDYDDGSILFEQAVPALDLDLNPVYIIVQYESRSQDAKYYKYGGRAAIRYPEVGEIGVTAVVEENADQFQNYELLGTDAKANLFNRKIQVRGEYAQSKHTDPTSLADSSGKAYLMNVKTLSNTKQVELYYRYQESSFSNPSITSAERGTEKYGLRYRFSLGSRNRTKISLGGEAYVRDHLNKDLTTRVNNTELIFGLPGVEAAVGYQYTESEGATSKEESQMAKGELTFAPTNNLKLSVGHARILSGDVIDQFPSKSTASFDFRQGLHLFDKIRLFGNAEYQHDEIDSTENPLRAKAGLELTVLKNTDLYTHTAFDNKSTSYTEGARQKFTFGETLHLGVRGESVQKISGQQREDFYVFGANAAYRRTATSQVSGKYEIRMGDDSDKHVIDFQTRQRFENGVDFIARQTYWYEDLKDKRDNIKSDGYAGWAFRPLDHDRLNVLAMLRFRYNRGQEYVAARTLVSAEAVYQKTPRLQLRGRYAIKRTDWESEILDPFTIYTDLGLAEMVYDLTDRFDLTIGARVLHQYQTNTYQYSLGAEVGMRLVQNLQGILGYNITGFEDRDFSDYSYWKQGPFASLRVKLDEQVFTSAPDPELLSGVRTPVSAENRDVAVVELAENDHVLMQEVPDYIRQFDPMATIGLIEKNGLYSPVTLSSTPMLSLLTLNPEVLTQTEPVMVSINQTVQEVNQTVNTALASTDPSPDIEPVFGDVPIPTDPAQLPYLAYSFTPDMSLSTGSTGQLVVVVQNNGDGDAYYVKLNITSPAEGVHLGQSVWRLNKLSRHSHQTHVVTLQVDADYQQTFVPVWVELSYRGGSGMKHQHYVPIRIR